MNRAGTGGGGPRAFKQRILNTETSKLAPNTFILSIFHVVCTNTTCTLAHRKLYSYIMLVRYYSMYWTAKDSTKQVCKFILDWSSPMQLNT